MTSNKEKCSKFKARKIKLWGHILDLDGMRIDPEQKIAIKEMTAPKQNEFKKILSDGKLSQQTQETDEVKDTRHSTRPGQRQSQLIYSLDHPHRKTYEDKQSRDACTQYFSSRIRLTYTENEGIQYKRWRVSGDCHRNTTRLAHRQHRKGKLSKVKEMAANLSVVDGLIMMSSRLYIPRAMRQETLNKRHTGHQG